MLKQSMQSTDHQVMILRSLDEFRKWVATLLAELVHDIGFFAEPNKLINRFIDLPRPDQEDLASAIGSTVNLILDNILEVNCGSMII